MSTVASFSGWCAEQRLTAKTTRIYGGWVERADRFLAKRGRSLVDADVAALLEFSADVTGPAARDQARNALLAYYRFLGRRHGDPACDLPRRAAGSTRSLNGRRTETEEGRALSRPSPAVLRFDRWMSERHYAPKTVKSYLGVARRAHANLEQVGVDLVDATIDDLHLWWSTLTDSTSTRNQARMALIAFYRAQGHRHGEPADELPALPKTQGLPRNFTADEYSRLITASHKLGGRHAVVGLLLCYTGCRITELRTARWEQFVLDDEVGEWRIEGKGSRRRGPKVRVVPLHPAVVPALRSWRLETSGAWLFPSSQLTIPGPISDPWLRTIVREIADVAGVEECTPHRFRHTVATTVLTESPEDLRGLQELLGHADLSTTQIYTKVLPGRLRGLVGALPS